MKKLVLKSDHSVEIIGTLERVPGVALIGEVRGVNDFDYAGGTDLLWDDQYTVTRGKQRIFVDELGHEHLERDLDVVGD